MSAHGILAGFVARCREAATAADVVPSLRELIQRPQALLRELAPLGSGVHTLHRSERITVLDVRWSPRASIAPHDHGMWAVVGVYAGREDAIMWRRRPGQGHPGIEPERAVSLGAGELATLRADAIHSVYNPLDAVTAAIHVYGGDFFDTARSEWDALSLSERVYDLRARLSEISGPPTR